MVLLTSTWEYNMMYTLCINWNNNTLLYSTVECIDVKVKLVKCNEQKNVLVSINKRTQSMYKLNMITMRLPEIQAVIISP